MILSRQPVPAAAPSRLRAPVAALGRLSGRVAALARLPASDAARPAPGSAPMRLRTPVLALLGLLAALAGPARAIEFVAAGAPLDLAQSRDYGRILGALTANGIKGFYPTFQYEEAPAPKSLGFETDFLPPCSPDAPAFRALRAQGAKLVVPAFMLYPNPAALPPLASDPLKALIACAGRANVMAVSNYDEPVDQGVPLASVRALYQRVKAVDPTLPVLMVHAPLIVDKPHLSSRDGRARYLRDVVAHSAFADVVGFDVYPIPSELAQLATPATDGRPVGFPQNVQDYVDWLAQALPGKRRLMAFQAFALSDLYEPGHLAREAGPEIMALIRPPSRGELARMLDIAGRGGVEMVIWWGQAALERADAAPWPDVLTLTRR